MKFCGSPAVGAIGKGLRQWGQSARPVPRCGEDALQPFAWATALTALSPHPAQEKNHLECSKEGKLVWSIVEPSRGVISSPDCCFLSHRQGIGMFTVCFSVRAPDLMVSITSSAPPTSCCKKVFKMFPNEGLCSLSEYTDKLSFMGVMIHSKTE